VRTTSLPGAARGDHERRDDGACPLERRRVHAEWAPVDALAAELRALGAGCGLHFTPVPQGGVQVELMVPAREIA